VPEVLWSRRFRGLAELDRQRQAFWPDGEAPAYVRLPWWQTHAALFAWEYAGRGKGADVGLSRVAGARLAVDYLEVSIRHRLWRRARRVRIRSVDVRNAVLGPPVRVALPQRLALRRGTRAGRPRTDGYGGGGGALHARTVTSCAP